MKDNRATWISEKHAENILQLPASFLRRSVVSGKLKGLIKYLRTMQHKYLYNKVDLENYLYENPELSGL